MTRTKNSVYKRIFAAICVVAIALMQMFVILPEMTYAAGNGIEICVQYQGERGDKIRTVCKFSEAQLEAMGCETYYYNNITAVGTVMRSVAYGPKIETVITRAGIDLSSIEGFVIRASDGKYTHNRFTQYVMNASSYFNNIRYYYPNLWLFYSNSGTPIINGTRVIDIYSGALNGATPVPSILALKSYCTKSTSGVVKAKQMTSAQGYRFFTGQTDLSYLEYEKEVEVEVDNPEEKSEPEEPTEPTEKDDEDKDNPEESTSEIKTESLSVQATKIVKEKAYHQTSSADVTSWDSIYNIIGIDVILKGAPGVNGIKLGANGTNVMIGCQKQIKAKIDGDVAGFNNRDLTWTTSDSSIATVDSNGLVTIHKKGAVTITATADNGVSASITLNGTENGKKNATAGKTGKKGDGKKNTKTMMVREISLGDEIKPEESTSESGSQDVAMDAEALEAAEEYSPKTAAAAAATAIAACGGGVVFRIRKYHLDIGKTVIKKEK